jgi:PST family polysaccharide transporter
MIFSLLGARQAGLYAATVLIAEAAGHIPAVFMSSTMPLLCQRSSDPARFRSLVQRSFRYLLMAAFPLCLLVTFGARELLGWLYGADFLDAAPALAILIWAEVWVFFGTVMRDTTIAAGFQRHLAAAMFGATLLNVVLNLLLIPTFGIRGAALASLVSYGMHACFAFLLFEETRPFSRLGLRALAAPALISGTLAALLLWIEPPVIFGAVLAAGAYLTLLVAARVLRAEDWTLLLQAIKR